VSREGTRGGISLVSRLSRMRRPRRSVGSAFSPLAHGESIQIVWGCVGPSVRMGSLFSVVDLSRDVARVTVIQVAFAIRRDVPDTSRLSLTQLVFCLKN